MSRTIIPSNHLYNGCVEARLHYPINSPPETIEIRGKKWVLERSAMRKWNSRHSMWVCPHCDKGEMSKNTFCPDCGVRFIGNEPSE